MKSKFWKGNTHFPHKTWKKGESIKSFQLQQNLSKYLISDCRLAWPSMTVDCHRGVHSPHDGKQKTFHCKSSWASSVQSWLNSKDQNLTDKKKKKKEKVPASTFWDNSLIFFHPAIFCKFQAMTFGVLPAKICWLLMVCCSRFCKLSQGDEGFLYSFERTLVT